MQYELDSEFQFFVADRVGSTMDLARRVAALIVANDRMLVVGARHQLQGRGRNQNSWQQAGVAGSDDFPAAGRMELVDLQMVRSFPDYFYGADDFLPVTFLVPRKRLGVSLEWVTLSVGSAVLDAVRATTDFVFNAFADVPFSGDHDQVFLKWPNDIVWFHKAKKRGKICGILCETSAVGNQMGPISIGIGLNFFSHPGIPGAESLWSLWKAMAGERKQATRRLARVWNSVDDRRVLLNYFARALMLELENYLCVPRSPGQLRSLTLERSIPIGTHLVVDGGRKVGRFTGIDLAGGLLLEGVSSPVLAGDVDVVPAPSVKLPKPKTHSTQEKKMGKISSEKANVTDIFSIDCGNSRMHCAVRDAAGRSVRSDIGYETFEKGGEAQLEKLLRPLLAVVAARQLTDLALVFCSVKDRPTTKHAILQVQRLFERMLPSLKLETLEVGSHAVLDLAGLQGAYNANSLGVDRALRFYFAAGKAREERRSVAMVGAGTALTCEAVSAEGRILESLIGPGLGMALEALHEHTAKLPSLEWNSAALEASQKWDTRNSMMRGVAFAEAGAVVNLILLHEIRRVFVSGGDAHDLCELLRPLLEKIPGDQIEIDVAEGLETDCLFAVGQELLRSKPGLLPSSLCAVKPVSSESDSGVSTLSQFEENESVRRIVASMSVARRKRLVARTEEKGIRDFRRLGVRVEAMFAGRRLDAYLSERFKFHTREQWYERILAREVCIQPNAQRTPTLQPDPAVWVKHTYRLKNLDQIWLYQPVEHEPDSVMHCDVLGDDGDVVVFSKPGNLVIHAVGQYSRNTFLQVAERMGYGNAAPIHRIDRETSGILVCARSLVNRRAVADAFRDGVMRKMYLAVCKTSAELPERFRVAAPIGGAVGSRIRLKLWVGGTDAVDALTNFVVLSRCDGYALIACFPKTGRTNQIRIHLAWVGAWIVGDKMYFPDEEVFLEFYEKGLTEFVLSSVEFPRHMLHNVAIQGPVELPRILSENAVICNFPEDFSAFSPLSNLMNLAGISKDPEHQSGFFRRFFEAWVDADFSDAPVLSGMAGN